MLFLFLSTAAAANLINFLLQRNYHRYRCAIKHHQTLLTLLSVCIALCTACLFNDCFHFNACYLSADCL